MLCALAGSTRKPLSKPLRGNGQVSKRQYGVSDWNPFSKRKQKEYDFANAIETHSPGKKATGFDQSMKSSFLPVDDNLYDEYQAAAPLQAKEFVDHVLEVHHTVLSNGLNVVSTDTGSQLSSISIATKIGSRYETEETYGSASMIEALLFKSSKKHPETGAPIKFLEHIATSVETSLNRETMSTSIETLRSEVDATMDVVADCYLNPIFAGDEIAEQKDILNQQASNHALSPAEYITHRALAAAFPKHNIGRSLYPPVKEVKKLHRTLLFDYLRTNMHVGSNMVISGTAVEHRKLVQLADKHFGHLPKFSKLPVNDPTPQFVPGRSVMTNPEESDQSVYFAFNWQGPSMNDMNNLYRVNILRTLLGEGASFATGGPGKGIFSRFYTNMVGVQPGLESIQCYLDPMETVGIFGVSGILEGGDLFSFLMRLSREMKALRNISPREFERVKNQFKTHIFMQLETGMVSADDYAKQCLYFEHLIPPHELTKLIDRLTIDDLAQMATDIISKGPAIAISGPPQLMDRLVKEKWLNTHFPENVY